MNTARACLISMKIIFDGSVKNIIIIRLIWVLTAHPEVTKSPIA